LTEGVDRVVPKGGLFKLDKAMNMRLELPNNTLNRYKATSKGGTRTSDLWGVETLPSFAVDLEHTLFAMCSPDFYLIITHGNVCRAI
tara:strand:- start:340 stop:600 length:261 start_codon:yes stop_codon:yes gene_type:complete